MGHLVACLLAASLLCQAESGLDLWLRYQALPVVPSAATTQILGPSVTVIGDSPLLVSARDEYTRAMHRLTGRIPRHDSQVPRQSNGVVFGTLEHLRPHFPALNSNTAFGDGDGYWIKTVRPAPNGPRYTVVTSSTARGVLYGVFALLRRVSLAQPLDSLDDRQSPYAPVRWLNHWDNLDGTIERGYGGPSIFWEEGRARTDLTRVRDYGRALASLGINACAINNVNANPKAIDASLLPDVARIAAVFRPWGVRVVLSVDFGSPRRLGQLDTFDPLDPRVIAWWRAKVDEIYAAVPDLAGLLIKADSEGRLGPSAYGRTHADAANVVARALAPHGGLLFYRGFVYNHRMDWRDPKNDRARAADDNFRPLDGQFDANVVIQIKHGPIDFQVREPASPLFGTLEKTNQAIELQITQEYFGQSRHTVFLAPMWKEALDFDLQARGPGTPVKALAAGRVFARPTGGFIGVSNVGLHPNWFNNHLSQANLYAFGRLAWNPNLTTRQILDEWTPLTFGPDPHVAAVVNAIQLGSWRTYENYTGPLGLQTLTDIVGNHYGVAVEASERNGWGQWHKADERGVGMDRTVKTGTGYAGQYRPAVARVYESLDLVPDELVVFFHHVPYTHRLRSSGKTVIQHLYDTHYEGAASVEEYVRRWRTLGGQIDPDRFCEILAQLEYQAGQAEVWRDAVTNWFAHTSGIADEMGRVGKYPGRIEAESMQLDGYAPIAVRPWESASGRTAISCAQGTCSAQYRYAGAPGSHSLRIRYFDQNNGQARFRVLLNGQELDTWIAADRLPSRRIDSSSSSLRIVGAVELRPGDEIRIEGTPESGETAALDYLELRPLR